MPSININKFIPYIVGVVLLIVSYFAISENVLQIESYKDTSMSNTIKPDSIIVVNKLYKQFDTIKRGELVAFYYQKGSQIILHARRVIGLPGDLVEMRENKLYVNGKECQEEYVTGDSFVQFSVVVPEGQYIVLNDNRSDMSSSLIIALEKKNIVGNIIKILDVPKSISDLNVFQ